MKDETAVLLVEELKQIRVNLDILVAYLETTLDKKEAAVIGLPDDFPLRDVLAENGIVSLDAIPRSLGSLRRVDGRIGVDEATQILTAVRAALQKQRTES